MKSPTLIHNKKVTAAVSREVNWANAKCYSLEKLCNLIPVSVPTVPFLVPVLAPSIPHHSISSLLPPFFLTRPLSNIQLTQQGVKVGYWLLTVTQDELSSKKTPREVAAVCPLQQPQLDSSKHVTPVKHSLGYLLVKQFYLRTRESQ